MASWDSARFDYRPDFTLDSKIKDATTTANKNRYDFDQQKALNRAWSNALDLSNGGRPSEAAFLQGAKAAGLSPEATDTYRKYLANAFSTGTQLAGDAMGMTSMGGNPGTIMGDRPMPTVTEAPAPPAGGPVADWLRPSAPAPSAPPVPTNETHRTDEEAAVHIKPEATPAPMGGEFRLPDPMEPERTYSAPPQEGVFTQYARGIDPAAAMAQAQGAAGGSGAPAQSETTLSPANMNPMEKEYAQRALSRQGIPGGSLEEQMGNLEAIARKSVRAPVPYNPQAAMVGGRYDQGAAAKEMNRAREDALRAQAETSAAVQKLAGGLLGDFGTVQGTTIARAGAESDLQGKARPREAINQQVAALNQELGTSFDPSKMGDEKTAADVLERVRLQKELLNKVDGIDVVRDPSGNINGRATAFQIVPLLEGTQKLEGLPGTEGSLQMMMRFMAPSSDLGTLVAIDPEGYSHLTSAGTNLVLSKMNSMPIDEFRAMVKHSINASPGMGVVYKNFQSKTPRPLVTVYLDDGADMAKPSRPAPVDPLATFLRPAPATDSASTPSAGASAPPSSPAAPKVAPDIRKSSKPLPQAGAISQQGKFFDGKNWRDPKAGDEDRKGRIWTGKRWL